MNVPKGLKFEELKKFMINRRFGRLVVVEYEGMSASDRRWRCLCDCGNFCSRKTTNLREPKDHSCRCWGEEKASIAGVKHGLHKSSEYQAYNNMKSRCYNPKSSEFPRYGARGITVCQRWLESFDNFISDMGLKPSADMSIDRVDVNGNYEPSNCRWADKLTQCNNTRRNRFFEIDGVRDTLANHCRKYGVTKNHVLYRIKKGLAPEEAFKKTA